MADPRIAVLGLGGTIASSATSGGAVPRRTADELVAAVPGLGDVAQLECETFRTLPSSDLTLEDIVALAEKMRLLYADGVVGLVVTHGTDTMEETAFALDLLVPAEIPVVLTGAMRHPDMVSSDGPGNLLAAVQVAASGLTAGAGAVVVMNDVVHAARYVRKVNTTSLAAFESQVTGPIGWVHEGQPRIRLYPSRHDVIEVAGTSTMPLVPIYTMAMGDDGSALRALLTLNIAGLVIEGTGGGHVRGEWASMLGELAGRVPVVIASRTGGGEVLRRTYGTPGGDRDLAERGLLGAGYLDGLKARVLLALLLMSSGREDVRESFADVVGSL